MVPAWAVVLLAACCCCCFCYYERVQCGREVVLDGDAAVQDSLQARKAGRPQAKRADGARRERTAHNAVLPGCHSFRGQRARARAREQPVRTNAAGGDGGVGGWCVLRLGRKRWCVVCCVGGTARDLTLSAHFDSD